VPGLFHFTLVATENALRIRPNVLRGRLSNFEPDAVLLCAWS